MESATVSTLSPTSGQPLAPNRFELLGRGISLSFSKTSITGEPLLQYQDACRQVSARGEEIRQEETELGTLVTITLEPDADAGSLLFTVVIPRAQLTGVGSEVRIEALGLLTRDRFARGPAADVQLQSSMCVSMKGSATFVLS
jgi:hypothetical protein